MRQRISISILLLVAVLNVNGQNCDGKAANNYLKVLFQNGAYYSDDSTKFLTFTDNLKALKTPALNKLLPDYCFFSTNFHSTYYEFLNVQTALAYSKNKKSLLVHSPLFKKTPEEFMQLFYGLKTRDTVQSVALAGEIVDILSGLTHKGHVNRLINLKEKDVISYELWWDDISYRIYDFYFDNTNRLTQIKVEGGAGRGAMRATYLRQ